MLAAKARDASEHEAKSRTLKRTMKEAHREQAQDFFFRT
jgi:hypothetical protein